MCVRVCVCKHTRMLGRTAAAAAAAATSVATVKTPVTLQLQHVSCSTTAASATAAATCAHACFVKLCARTVVCAAADASQNLLRYQYVCTICIPNKH